MSDETTTTAEETPTESGTTPTADAAQNFTAPDAQTPVVLNPAPIPETPKLSRIEALEQFTGLSRDELIDRLLVGAYSEGALPSASVLLSGQRG